MAELKQARIRDLMKELIPELLWRERVIIENFVAKYSPDALRPFGPSALYVPPGQAMQSPFARQVHDIIEIHSSTSDLSQPKIRFVVFDEDADVDSRGDESAVGHKAIWSCVMELVTKTDTRHVGTLYSTKDYAEVESRRRPERPWHVGNVHEGALRLPEHVVYVHGVKPQYAILAHASPEGLKFALAHATFIDPDGESDWTNPGQEDVFNTLAEAFEVLEDVLKPKDVRWSYTLLAKPSIEPDESNNLEGEWATFYEALYHSNDIKPNNNFTEKYGASRPTWESEDFIIVRNVL